jgi:hypothetical protein
MHGQEGYFDINIDTDKFTLVIKKRKEMPGFYPHSSGRRRFITDIEGIKQVNTKTEVPNDFYGNAVTGEERLPGPFTQIIENQEISIDPRKL